MSSSPSSRNSTQSDELPQATRNDVTEASRRLARAELRVPIAETLRGNLPCRVGRSTVEQELMDTMCGAALDQVKAELDAAHQLLNHVSGECEMYQLQNTHFDIDTTDNTGADDEEPHESEPICVPEDNTIKTQHRMVYEAFLAVEKDVREDFTSRRSAHGDPATLNPAELNEAFAKVYKEVATYLQAELSACDSDGVRSECSFAKDLGHPDGEGRRE